MWLALSFGFLLAQPPPETRAEARPPVFYETTTVTARPVSGASGAVTVVSSEELAAAAARSGTEVLHEVPGLSLLASGGRAGVTNAWVRGADPNFTLVLLDGIPLNDSTELQGGAVNLEARAVSHYLDRQLPVPDRDTVVGYGLLGFAGSWHLGRGLSLRARLDNLADRSYETLIGFPGPGRSFWAGLGWER
jgi:outer membrane cobalamin receptor